MSYPIPDDARFFRDGVVELLACDYQSRMGHISLTMPCCLFQTVTPHLLNHGTVSGFRLLEPTSVWLPIISEGALNVDATRAKPISAGLNVALREEVSKILKLFENLKAVLLEPSDIIPILPLGIYIKCEWSVSVDSLAQVLVGINSINVAGIYEFQVALASIVQIILEEFETVRPKKSLTTPGM